MKKTKTCRGFDIIHFSDRYNAKCSLQKSSLVEPSIWFGVDDAEPKILASKVDPSGTGWIPYYIPEDVLLTTRMHLSRKQVRKLLWHLIKFIIKGDI